MEILDRLARRWSRPVDSAGLVLVLRGFGLIMAVEMVRYLSLGFVHRYFVEPKFHFSTAGFEWLQPPGEVGMTGLFICLGIVALALAWGVVSRVAVCLFVVGFGSIFLMDQAYYQNHHYLILLMGLFFAVVGVRPDRMAATWMIDLARFQVGVVYVFGGLAKINSDWLSGAPMTQWMALRADWPVIGPWLNMAWSGVALAWFGLMLDLLIVPLLLWGRTRRLAFGFVLVFHAFNAVLFKIGVFPSLMVLLTTVFFAPDWCRRTTPPPVPRPAMRGWVMPVVLTWMLCQFAIPMRGWFSPGQTSWTEVGHRFSWRMKLRSKIGRVRFHALDRERGTQRVIDPAVELTPYQGRKMATRPQLILKYAHHLRDTLKSEGSGVWAIHADARATLNGRPAQPLIDPSVDLAQESGCEQERWVVPLQK
jgi:vitamin K-dependent gamma-carboxylase